MIITSHMQNIIQIYPCLLKLSRKQESVTDGQTDGQMADITISTHRYRGGIKIYNQLGWSLNSRKESKYFIFFVKTCSWGSMSELSEVLCEHRHLYVTKQHTNL
jgi:hypothetical protein